MIDSNIIFSAALYRKGGIASLLEEILRKFQVCICDFSIEELQLVMQNKFLERVNELDDFLNELTYEFIYTPKKLGIDYHVYRVIFPIYQARHRNTRHANRCAIGIGLVDSDKRVHADIRQRRFCDKHNVPCDAVGSKAERIDLFMENYPK